MKPNTAFKHSNPVWIIVYCLTAMLVLWLSITANQKGVTDFHRRVSLQPGVTQGLLSTKSMSL